MDYIPLLFEADLEKQRYSDNYNKEIEHWWWRTRRNYILDFITKCKLNNKNNKILDVGCGSGGELELLKEDFQMAVGLDYHPEALKVSRERAIKYLVLGNGNDLPLKNNSFDLIQSLDVLYHREINEDRYFRELKRVCKPGGFIIVTVAAFDFLKGREDITGFGARRYTRKKLIKLINESGLTIIKIKYAFSLIFPVILAIRSFLKFYRILFGIERVTGTDVFSMPKILNEGLISFFKIEIFLSNFINFPFGSSLICLLKKPKGH